MDFHDLIKIDNSLIMIVLGISDNAVFYVSVILFERSHQYYKFSIYYKFKISFNIIKSVL